MYSFVFWVLTVFLRKRVECFGVAMVHSSGRIEDLSVNVISQIEPCSIRRKEIVKENCFWNNADNPAHIHIDFGVTHSISEIRA
jgi:hypothetical protein